MTQAAQRLPRKTREVQNVICDSTRWSGFKFRPDDIIIALTLRPAQPGHNKLSAKLFSAGRTPRYLPPKSLRGWMLDSFR